MCPTVLAIFAGFLCACNAVELKFPENFLFGTATASYQIEGAWNASGKGENIWDRITHQSPQLISDLSNGDVACDAYSKTRADVKLLKNMGIDFYRFSISWSRLLPSGFVSHVNPDGIRYYNELIDELLANNIEPYVTMYHWDLPQPLQEIGGWPNPLLAGYFVQYANVLFRLFGDRVKNWITFNEPLSICYLGYSVALMAPGYRMDGIGCYLCGHTILLAHAQTYRLYYKKYKSTQNGRVGIAVDTNWYGPNGTSPEDLFASETKMQMSFGWFVHPILSNDGDYPKIMKDRIRKTSRAEGFLKSRLPAFTRREVTFVRGSADFLGLNHYTTYLCSMANNTNATANSEPSHWKDVGVTCHQDPSWERSASDWLAVVPWGLRKLLSWVKNEYNNPNVIITENGFSDATGTHDCRRVNYINSYLKELLNSIHEDGCKVTGYTAWSFMDNFEWFKGYTERFGLHFVNFTDPNRPRIPKLSSFVYSNIIATRKIDQNFISKNFEKCE